MESIRVKSYVANLSPVALFIAATLLGGVVYFREVNRIDNSLRAEEHNRIETAVADLGGELAHLVDDIQELAHGVELKRFLASGENADLEGAADTAALYSRLNPELDQIRCLDGSGQELLCVSQVGRVHPSAELTNRSDTELFKASSTLDPDALYLSAITLSGHAVSTESEPKPTIQCATPVFDVNGTRRGVYVINYLAESLFRMPDIYTSASEGRIRVLNRDGYWLKGAASDREWGFLYPERTDATLSSTDPELWQRMVDEPRGSMRRNGGIVFWRHVSVEQMISGADAYVEEPEFIIASRVAPDDLGALYASPRVQFGIFASMMLLLSGVVYQLLQSRLRSFRLLRDNEENLAITLRSIGDGVLTTDSEGRVTGLNPKAELLTGWSESEAKGKQVEDVCALLSESTREPIEVTLRQLLTSKEIREKYRRAILVAKDGIERYIAEIASPLYDGDKNILGSVLVIRDVSAEKAAETERDRLFSLSLDLLCVAHEDGYFKRVNPAFTQTLGWSEAEFLERPFLSFVHPDDASATALVVENLMASGEMLMKFENRYRHKEGGWRVLSWKCVPQPDGFIFGTARDVTEIRKEAEARNFLASIIESSEDAIISKDLNGIILSWNPAAERLFGYAASEIIGTPMARLFPPELVDEEFKILASLKRGEGVNRFESVRITKDGRHIDVSVTISPMTDADGNYASASTIVQDITQQKQLDIALRSSEAFNRTIIESSPDCLMVLSLEGNVLFMNAGGCRIMEVEDFGEIENVEWLSFWSGEDRVSAEHALRSARAGDITRFRGHCPTRKGNMRYWDIALSPVYGIDGKPEKLVSVSRDVTEQQLAQEALREAETLTRQNEELLRCVLDSMTASIAVLDRQGTIVSVNNVWDDFAKGDNGGAAPSAVRVGESYLKVFDVVEGDFRDDLIAMGSGVKAVLDGTKDIFTAEYDCQIGNERRWFLMNVSALSREGGGAVIAHTDITDRKMATQRLNDFKAALDEHALVSIADVNGVITYANDKFCSIAKYPRNELIGQDHRIVNSQYHSAAFMADLWATIKSGRVWKGELRNRAKDGTHYWVATTIVPFLDDDNRPFQYIAIRTDITQRKETEADLELSKKQADTANQAKSAFLANMSHEIRTPLNGVIGTVDVLRQTSLRPYQVELAEVIRESSYSLLDIIDGILDFSKIEAGKVDLEIGEVSLSHLVETVCEGLNPVAVRNRVDLCFFTDPGLPDKVLSDWVRLRQILSNLVGNAIKFSGKLPRPGSVNVRVERNGLGSIRMTIEDNGIGMTPDIIARLFKPFTQGDSSTTRSFGGTGLGLSICKQLVALLDGEISVRSEPNEGTIFTVTLPVEPAPGAEMSPVLYDLSGVDCILSVEDEELAADWRAYLEHAGAKVNFAREAEGLASLGAERAGGPVVITQGRQPLDFDALRAAFPSSGTEVQHVVVVRSCHRRPHLEAPGIVLVDGDAMRRGTFLHAVAIAAGRSEAPIEEPTIAYHEGLSLPSLEEAAAQGRLILVAEDNETNQKVIRHQLALLGYVCEIAKDGDEALERWRTGKFALVLSDLHMPGLDGHALATQIRIEEKEDQRIPIIAFTANITKGEGARCRQAGMDDYLTKPAQLETIHATLEKWLGPARSYVEIDSPAVNDTDGIDTSLAVWDRNVLPQMLGTDNPGLLAEFLGDYLDSAEKARAEIVDASVRGDWKSVGAVAHRLKSSSQMIGALNLAKICNDLQAAVSSDGASEVNELIGRFENEIVDLFTAIQGTLTPDR